MHLVLSLLLLLFYSRPLQGSAMITHNVQWIWRVLISACFCDVTLCLMLTLPRQTDQLEATTLGGAHYGCMDPINPISLNRLHNTSEQIGIAIAVGGTPLLTSI